MSRKSVNQRQVMEKYIRDRNVPEHLYKFRRWHCGHNTDVLDNECQNCRQDRLILSDQAVWFASPASFNDPFDCKLPFRYDLMSKEDQYQRVLEVGRKGNPRWSEERLNTETKRILQASGSFSGNPKLRGEVMSRFWDLIANEYGILSFAGDLDSILLWSHYADSHRGYCVEVDAHQLAKELLDLYRTDRHVIHPYRVAYQADYPVIIPSKDENESFDRYMKVLTIKSSAWRYEQEYRFIYDNRTNLARSISKGAIKSVILGCQMPTEHREEIRELVLRQLPDIEIWEANRSLEKFKLDFQRVSG